MSASSRAALPLIRHEGRPPQVLAAIALGVACLLAGCNSSTPTPPPAPAGSPAARVEASAPVQAAPSSEDPAPSASAEPPPTPTPDAEAVRKAAAAGYLAAGEARERAWARLPWTHKDVGGGPAKLWGRYLAALRQLQVPADTAADLQDLIRTISRLQAVSGEGGSDNRLRATDWRYQTRFNNVESKMYSAVDRVRADLGLPPLCRAQCG